LAQAEDKPYKIAILEFDNLSDAATKENMGRLVSEFLITAAVNSGTFNVVERAALKKVLDEMQFGAGSKSPGTAAQAIGAMVGAKGVLTGSVVKSDGSVRLDARLVDVASGSIVAARSAYAKEDMRSLSTAAELLVNQLEGDLAKLPPPAQDSPAPQKQQEGNAPQQSAQ
jgi:TolB-like protein